MKQQSLLLVGYFSDDPTIYTYSSSFARALRSCGYRVTTFNTKQKLFNYDHRLLAMINNYRVNHVLKKTVAEQKPDILFLIKPDTITAQTIAWIKDRYHPTIIAFHPDNPFAFWNGNSNSNILSSLHLIDHFLCWSKMLIPAVQSAGCDNVHYFPFAFDEEIFFKEIAVMHADEEKYSSDVCFVGTWEPSREAWLSAIAQHMPTINLAIWGNQWKEKLSPTNMLHKHLRGPAIYGDDMIKAFRLSKIVLNFIRQQNMTSHNMRTCEVPASKAFLLTERTYEQAVLLFREDEDIACFATPEELIKKIAFYLPADKLRKQMVENAFALVQKFTITKQLSEIMSSITHEKRRCSYEKHHQHVRRNRACAP